MKFTLSAVVVLALAASQATAVVPKPVKECTHSYVVEPGTPDCVAFATKFGITFDDLLKWNEKLSPKCDNLDVGEPLCVSITKGDCCLNENPKGALVPQPGVPPQGNLWDPAPYTKPAGGQPTSAGSVPPPAATSAPSAGNGAQTSGTGTKPTNSGSAGSSTSAAPPAAKTDNKTSAAASSKASIVLGAAGLLLSAVYML